MAWFRNMKIGKQIVAVFLVLAIITGIVTASGFLFISKIRAQDKYLYEHITQPISVLSSVRLLFQQIEVTTRDLVTAYSDFDIKANKANLTNYQSQLDVCTEQLQKNYEEDTEDQKELLNDFINAKSNYLKNLTTLVKLAEVNNDNEAKMLMKGSLEDAANAEMRAIEAMVSSKMDIAEKTAESNNRIAKIAVIIMFVLMVVNTGAAIGAGILISRRLSRSINKLLGLAQNIASNNLDVEVPDMGKDEIGELAKMFSQMADNLNAFALNVHESAEQVELGSRHVAASSQALSQGATEQASSVEELTVSLEQISAQTQRNAGRADEANHISLQAKDDLLQGIEEVNNLIQSMDDINEAATNISKIIKAIDDIAFQTNILALNAAVEAAHAGQHGKGFAVVAEEVRNLAARSASAAKETTNLIEHAIKTTESGTKIAAHTATSLQKITEGASMASDLVSQLAVSSNEQSIGIAQINKAVAQVSEIIQTNSASSEEGAAASEELSSQATMLKQLTESVKLKTQKSKEDSENSESPEPPNSQEGSESKDKEHKNKQKDDKSVSIDLSGASYGKYSQ